MKQGSPAVPSCSLGILLLIGSPCPLPIELGSRAVRHKNVPHCTLQKWMILMLGFQATDRDYGVLGPLALY